MIGIHREVKSLTFTVPGSPRSKKVARRVKLPDGRMITHTPPENVLAETAIRDWFLAAVGQGWEAWEGPVIVNIIGYFLPPKSWPNWRWVLLDSGSILYCKTPDGDNLRKLVQDALTGVAYRDDRQCHGQTFRYYSRRARTEIELLFLDPMPACKSDVALAAEALVAIEEAT